ncbi:MAG TPA: acylneuraminate cytidylyltransferase, partial [Campylobacterales bacterium]|nr:acylneuraminate cytidylyltransferase [Campylobacterales bacterium]
MILVNNFIFLQARMGSSRLPGKTLKLLDSIPMIMQVVNRLSLVNSCKIVIL